MVNDCRLRFECSRLLYVPTLLVFACLSGLYLVGGNDRYPVTAIENAENSVIYLALFISACKGGHSKTFFG